ncbi:uncharacterized protein LOC135466162 [Liolophura sinensis]|uniref:uncharacterized protein LOC135466162 n=1 Tax=Liolophura sinensis TaxID=3198878 RepID=UPI003158C66D
MARILKSELGHFRKSINPKSAALFDVNYLTRFLLTKTGPFSTSAVAMQSREKAKPYSEIPSPKGLPVVGTLFQIPSDPAKQRPFLVERCKQFFPIYREKAGVVDMVFVFDMQEIEKLFRNEAKYPRRFNMDYWVNYRRMAGKADGILVSDGEAWHRMRKVIDKPMLRIKDVAGYADDVNEVVTDFLERLGEIRQGDGLIPDLERELFNWSLETIGKILFERRFGGLSDDRDPEFQEFIDAVRIMFTCTLKLIPYPIWFSKLFARKVYRAHNQCWDVIFRIAKKCVDERMNELAAIQDGEEKGAGVLSYLLSENSLPVEEIYSNLTELMNGAVDTTSTTMLWMFQELALNPHVQDKLLAEVENVVPDGKIPTYQDLQKMPYLKAVIKETLRKYPVGSGVSRYLHEDMVLCGYEIPANTNVTVAAHVLCRLPQYFDDPEAFKPERWLRGTGDKINPFFLMAFGMGTRMCVGRRVAELEMYMLVSRLIQKYSVEPGFTEPAVESMQLVIRPDRPIKIKLVDRKDRLKCSRMAAALWKSRPGDLVRQLCLKGLDFHDVKAVQMLPTVTKIDLYSTSAKLAQPGNPSPGAVKPFSEMPTPKGLPLFGTMFQVPRDTTKMRKFLLERCRKFYPIYKENVPGFNIVVLYDVVEIEKLFRKEGKYPRRFDFLYWIHYRKTSGEADGVLTSNDEPWHQMRKVIDKPMLRIKDVAGYADDVNEVVTDFLERLGEIRQGDGLIPDLERELFSWSLETIGKILYEKRFGGLSSSRDPEMQEFIDAVRIMFTTTLELMVYPIWFSKIFLRQTYNSHIRSWDTLFRIARKCVDERMNEIAVNKKGEKAAGVLSHLLSDKSLPIQEVYSNITELMTGAVDTTSTAMLWMFQELALNPDVQDKLLAEVESVVPDGKIPTYQDLQKMPYLKAVSKETLRKYSVASGIPRVLEEDMELGGYLVPAKTPVVVYNTVMGHLPQYFEEPEKFKPERWLRGTGDKINSFSLLPFGYGTRMCVGRRVAELEINMLLSRLIRKYSIEPAFTERAVESMGMILKPDRPIKIKLNDRK